MADNLQGGTGKEHTWENKKTQDIKHQIPEPKKGRKFERHSGTGFGHNTHTKRSGKGSYNWGDEMANIDEEIEAAHNEA